eukprot:IDg20699t1
MEILTEKDFTKTFKALKDTDICEIDLSNAVMSDSKGCDQQQIHARNGHIEYRCSILLDCSQHRKCAVSGDLALFGYGAGFISPFPAVRSSIREQIHCRLKARIAVTNWKIVDGG